MASDRVATESPAQRPALVQSLLLLVGIVALVWPLFAAYGFWRAASQGLFASLVAAAVCGGAACLSLVITVMAQHFRQPIAGILAGMVVRMLVPLLALLAIPRWDASLLKTGVQEMVLGYYLVALAAETWLLLRLVPVSKAGVAKAA